MELQSDVLPRSVGRIRVTDGHRVMQGTGFLIHPTRVLTCAHCLRISGVSVDSGTIAFTQAKHQTPVPFAVVFDRYDPDVGLDVAVLELKDEIPGAACLPLARVEPSISSQWRSFGHPASVDGEPVFLGGTLTGQLVRAHGGIDGTLLALGVDPTVSKHAGISGAPVFGEEGVVGILSNQLFQREAAGLTPVQIAYAVSIQRLFALGDFSRAARPGGPLKVFIAYRRHSLEEPLAHRLKQALDADGHDAFIDVESIRVGADWQATVQTKIEEADAFIPLLTQQSVQSEMLLQELRAAYHRRRRTGRPALLPVQDPDLTLPYEFETYLGSTTHFAPWRGEIDTPGAVKRLLAALRHERPAVPTAPPEMPPSSRISRDFTWIRPTVSAVRLDDPFYVERAQERLAYKRLDGPPTVLTVTGSKYHGKSSLLFRFRNHCQSKGRRVALIDFQAFGSLPPADEPNGFITFLSDFTRQLCKALRQPSPVGFVEDPNDAREALLNAIQQEPRTVLILDGVDRLISQRYGESFFQTLRAWANDPEVTFTFVFSTAVEPAHLVTDVTVSPFNLDPSPTILGPFDADAIRTLAARAGADLNVAAIDQLSQITGGHPAMTRQALASLLEPDDGGGPPRKAEVERRLSQLFMTCGEPDGPFGTILRAIDSAITRSRKGSDLKRVMADYCANVGPRSAADQVIADELEARGLLRKKVRQLPYSLAFARYFSNHP